MPTLSHLSVFTAFRTRPELPRQLFLGLLALVLLIISVKYAGKILKPGNSGEQSRSAFLRWRTMIHEVFEGTNIYVGKNEYPNPPIMAIVLRPFAELPPIVGAMAWFYTKVLLAVLAAVWTFRLVCPANRHTPELAKEQPTPGDAAPHTRIPDGAMAAAILLTLPAIMGDLTHNNINIFILFLIAACLELYRRGLDTSSGLVLALAVACKVTPLLFLAYFIWKRAGRVVAGFAVGLVLWVVIVPAAMFGWERNIELHTDWYRLMVERPLLKGEITTEHPNQAFVGWVYRLFTSSPSFITYIETPEGDIPAPAEYHNLMDIGRPAAWVVVKGFTLAFAVAVMLLCRGPRSERQGWRFAAECGLIVMGMLLLSERTWKHHAVVLLIPVAALAFAATLQFSQRVRRWMVGSMIAAGLLMATPGLFGTRIADLALVYGTHTMAFLLLTASLCVVLACGLEQQDRASGANRGRIPD